MFVLDSGRYATDPSGTEGVVREMLDDKLNALGFTRLLRPAVAPA